MDKETIEEITYRIVKNTAPANLKVSTFEIAREASSFQMLCMLVGAAIAEEREACIECAERWLEESSVLDVRGYITGERF